jgi:ABC-type branched-subunit amino acid transport system permease subunit
VLVGDLVPPRLRAQYFGNRNLMIMLAALLVAPLAGWLIKAGNGWLGQPNLGYQAVFALAFVTGLALGSGYLNPWVWIPIALAFSVYYWPRLKAFFNTISSD